MSDFYDRSEKRPPRSREIALMRDLRALLSISKARAPVLRAQLSGIDVQSLQSRADLARIPVLRRRDILRFQGETPPFGGMCATRPSGLKRLLLTGGRLVNPEGHAKDWWNLARVLFAAGFRRGDLVLNCFSYHLMSGGHMVDSGAQALGCPVIPAGDSAPQRQVEIIRRLKPVAYCGTGAFLKLLLDASVASGLDITPIKHALVAGPGVTPELRSLLKARGIEMYVAYGTTELGAVAYETLGHDGLIVNEGLIVEIVRPGTGEPVDAGEIGEVVVTRLNGDYPLLRFGTGDLSAFLPGLSPCGRTNMRLIGCLGRVDRTAERGSPILHAPPLDEIQPRRVPGLGSKVALVSSGSRPDDGLIRVDERFVG